jgi:heparanase
MLGWKGHLYFMTSRTRSVALFAGVAFVALGGAMAQTDISAPESVSVAPRTMPRVATVDERYESYNVEVAEVIGGSFWKPYTPASIAALNAKAGAPPPAGPVMGNVGQDTSMYQRRTPIDLSNPRLRKLARALGPAYMRTSGTWMNQVYFHDSDTTAPTTAPKGFDGVLTRAQWKDVVDFAKAVNAKLVISFAISAGVRDAAGVWTPVQARPLIDYTRSVGGDIAAAEMFNEPTLPAGGAPPGYDAESYAKDFAVFKPFIRAAAPHMLIAGPGSVGEGGVMEAVAGNVLLKTADMLSARPEPKFDVYSYHSYAAVSLRCVAMGDAAQTTAGAALSEQWLSRPDSIFNFYIALRNRYRPDSKGVWITETADAACGGNPWAETFLDTFRYLDQLGRLAKGATVSFHNTLASSEYGLLDQKTFAPRPNYWASLLWRRFMGTTVLDAGPSREGLHLYAHCMRGHPGGVTLLAINNSHTQASSLQIPSAAERYTLSAQKLEAASVELNGHELKLGADDALPALGGARVPAGAVALAPATSTFLTIADARNPNCR